MSQKVWGYIMNISDFAIERIYEYVNRTTSTDTAHDFDHIKRVVSITKKLCKEYDEVNTAFAEIIALLHEMNDGKLFPPTQINDVSDFLLKLSFSPELVQRILESISMISYRKYPSLRHNASLEVKIVQDADRIDAIGAIGIARAFAYGGSKGYPLYSKHKESFGIIQHFDDKLLLLYDLLNTQAAKNFAKKRNEFVKLYYESFLQELHDLDD